MVYRRLVCLVTFALVATLSTWAIEPVNQDSRSIAVEGYDVVAYHTDGKPTPGSASHEHEWMGARWRFASAAHREQFAAAPEKYAPQYGGYCAYAVANDDTASIDPEAWTVVDGRLFLNYSKRIQARWERKRDEYIVAADRNWPGLRDKGK